jgi:hypothetical protein
MSMWLYQINQQVWQPERLRLELWEGEKWSWPIGSVRTQKRPEAGDTVVFYCTKSKGSDPGFYGWAVVAEYYEPAGELYFTPTAPTNYLKMTPWWDDDAEALADRIRGKMKQATLWQIDDDARDEVRAGIRRWLGGMRER